MQDYKGAHGLVLQAVRSGGLVRPDKCELCGANETHHNGRPSIVAHHWRGHEYPLDVWWVCTRCNRKLHGVHDASMSKDVAKKYIALPVTPKPGSAGMAMFILTC
jgi:hypothetical protein